MDFRVVSRKKLHSCKLNKDDIIELVTIAKNNMARSAKVELSIKFDDQEITENKIEKLLKNPRLPDKLYELSVEVLDEDRRINISFSRQDYSESVVRGQDEEWVSGKQTQILDFINKRKTKNFIFHKMSLFVVAAIPFYLAVFAYDKSSLSSKVTLGLGSVFYFSVAAIIFSSSRLFPYSIVEIKKKESNSLIWAFIIGFLSSLIAGMIISFFKA